MRYEFKAGDKVEVSGEVKWGDTYVNVSSPGIIEDWKKGAYALVNIEQVDGDFGVCVHVLKKNLSHYQEMGVLVPESKVVKMSGKPFKSGSKVNTIKGVTAHPVFPEKTAYTFVEDDSIVEAWRCRPNEEAK